MEENKIIFMGTAGDSIIAGKHVRASGGIIIKIGETQLHLDPGPGTLGRAIPNGINLRANTAILVSNNNILNSNDVNIVIDAMTYGGMDKNGVLVAAPSIINGLDNEKPILTEKHKSYVEKIIVATPNHRFAIEDIEINVIKAHGEDPSGVGFKILAPKFTLGYTSNTKYDKELVEGFKGCDILILNVTDPSEDRTEGNLNSADAARLIGKVNPKLAILTHFGYKMIKADPLNEVRMIQRETNVQTVMAKDGFSFNPTSYSANSPQSRLSGYTHEKKPKEEPLPDNQTSEEDQDN